MRLNRGWAWEVEVGDQHHLVAEAEAVVVEEEELELLQLGAVGVRLRGLVVVVEVMDGLVAVGLRLGELMGELVAVVVCWIQAMEGEEVVHCPSTVVVVLAGRRMAGEVAASPVHCLVS